jgi:hypothetical protein
MTLAAAIAGNIAAFFASADDQCVCELSIMFQNNGLLDLVSLQFCDSILANNCSQLLSTAAILISPVSGSSPSPPINPASSA